MLLLLLSLLLPLKRGSWTMTMACFSVSFSFSLAHIFVCLSVVLCALEQAATEHAHIREALQLHVCIQMRNIFDRDDAQTHDVTICTAHRIHSDRNAKDLVFPFRSKFWKSPRILYDIMQDVTTFHIIRRNKTDMMNYICILCRSCSEVRRQSRTRVELLLCATITSSLTSTTEAEIMIFCCFEICVFQFYDFRDRKSIPAPSPCALSIFVH